MEFNYNCRDITVGLDKGLIRILLPLTQNLRFFLDHISAKYMAKYSCMKYWMFLTQFM